MQKAKGWLVVVICLALLSACTNGGTKNNNGGHEDANSSDKGDSPSSKLVDIEYMTVVTGSTPPDEDKDYVRNKFREELGLSIKRTLFNDPAEFKNQFNVRLAAGNYPDIFTVDRLSMSEYVNQGLLLDLTPYLDKLKPVMGVLSEEDLRKGQVNGKLYAIPKRPSGTYASTWIRKDWLDHLNLEVPKTLDEFLAVAKAFTELDPDGNNQDDTYGVTGTGLLTFSAIFGAHGVGMPGTTYLKEGQLTNSLYDPHMADAINYIKNMMDMGVVDPDILSYSGAEAADKLYEGKAGISFVSFVYLTSVANKPKVTALDPHAEWIQIAPPAGPGGSYDGSNDIGSTPGLLSLSSSLAEEPEKLDKIIEMLNYVATPEGELVVTLGEEGKHWEQNDEGVKKRTPGDHSTELTFIYQFLGRNDLSHLASIGYEEDVVKFAASTPRIETYDAFTLTPDHFNRADATRFIEEEMAKFVYGKRSISEYDDFLQTLGTTFGYQTLMDSVEQQLKDLGIGK
ncbi:extracellular solute-binding protein [Paenibacillus sp. J5C_2022]|uniref:extracellular solute-binding protein n=1 Tax=Paenibacillus sp. J5C2022 TaxID=2977129 RepID=UPI0021D363DE|nr:extracellular solute-binding protein [Paenibacillus sp. J5C2022]MCU6709023.1 extracellular solute-binding protein [Paenibacillus sp. J5C2022]